MELINRTEFPAEILRTIVDDRRFAAAVVARVTFELTAEGPVPSSEQPWIVSPIPWEYDGASVEGDHILPHRGVDVLLFGNVWAPDQETTELEVSIRVGSFSRRILAIGDRVWVRDGDQMVPSSPSAFRVIPLTTAQAFGGKIKWDGLELGYPLNPDGKGFVLEEKDAPGTPLPNIEETDSRITRWNDQPEPVGVGICPVGSVIRTRNGIVLDENNNLRGVKPELFNWAFPGMIAERVVPGDDVVVTNALPSGAFSFRVPNLPLVTRLGFGGETITRRMAIDQIGIEPERGRFFLAYRYPFRYVVYPRQQRSCELLLA